MSVRDILIMLTNVGLSAHSGQGILNYMSGECELSMVSMH